MSKAEPEAVKAQIRELLKKVPQSVVNAPNIGVVQNYKDAVDKANKLLSSPRANIMNLNSSLMRLRQYWS